jgi:hypothetical protein
MKKLKASKQTQSRPTEITIICILGFITTPIFIGGGLFFLGIGVLVSAWYAPLPILESLVYFLSFVGMWMMKKWGVYTYTSLFAFIQVLLLWQGSWDVHSLMLPTIIIMSGFKHIEKMS